MGLVSSFFEPDLRDPGPLPTLTALKARKVIISISGVDAIRSREVANHQSKLSRSPPKLYVKNSVPKMRQMAIKIGFKSSLEAGPAPLGLKRAIMGAINRVEKVMTISHENFG